MQSIYTAKPKTETDFGLSKSITALTNVTDNEQTDKQTDADHAMEKCV